MLTVMASEKVSVTLKLVCLPANALTMGSAACSGIHIAAIQSAGTNHLNVSHRANVSCLSASVGWISDLPPFVPRRAIAAERTQRGLMPEASPDSVSGLAAALCLAAPCGRGH